MDLSNSKLDFGLDLDYDKEKQEETKVQERLKVYKFNYAKTLKIIKCSLLILELVNILFLRSYLYWDFISKSTFKITDSSKSI